MSKASTLNCSIHMKPATVILVQELEGRVQITRRNGLKFLKTVRGKIKAKQTESVVEVNKNRNKFNPSCRTTARAQERC